MTIREVKKENDHEIIEYYVYRTSKNKSNRIKEEEKIIYTSPESMASEAEIFDIEKRKRGIMVSVAISHDELLKRVFAKEKSRS